MHFIRRSRGHRGGIADADLFRGRSAAVSAIVEWVKQTVSPGQPLVVTGQPGAGKSAVLARAVLTMWDSPVSNGVCIHARGITYGDVVDALGKAAGIGSIDDADALMRTLHNDGPELVVAVDALDEVDTLSDRRQIVDLLMEVARLPRARVAVATRALSTGARYGVGAVLPSLGVHSAHARNLVDLDSDEYFDREGFVAFVAAVLIQHASPHPAPSDGAWAGYRSDEVLTARLADIIADRAGRNYLVGALSASQLSSADRVVDPTRPGFAQTQIPATVGEAITKYLDGLPVDQQSLMRGRLTALAYGRGDGIDDDRWARFATVLGYPTNQIDIDTLRLTAAASYLLHTNTGDNGRTSRLFHQALIDELIAARGRKRSDEKKLLETLRPGDGDTWLSVDAYARMHAADHAYAGAQLSRLLHDETFLCAADIDRLMPLLPHQAHGDDLSIALLLRQAAHGARLLSPQRRARLLALTAAHLGLHGLLRRFNALTPSHAVSWAHSSGSPHQRLTGHSAPVSAVAVGRLGNREVIISGDHAGQVRMWDSTGHPIGEAFANHSGGVEAVAVGRFGSRDVIVSCGGNAVQLWDVAGHPISEALVGHTGQVVAVAVGRLGDHDVIVSGGGEGTIRIWDINGRPIGLPIITAGQLSAVAVGRLGDRGVIVSGGSRGNHREYQDREGVIQRWDATGRQIGEPVTGHTGAVAAVTVGRLNNRDVIVSGGYDGELRMWDSAGGLIGQPFVGHTESVWAVAVGRLGDRDVIASGSSDHSVRLWDATGHPIGDPLTGHTEEVTAVAIGRLGNRDVIVSGCGFDDPVVRLWDTTGRPIGEPFIGHIGEVGSAAVGRLGGREVIASGGFGDATVRLWDTAGQPIGKPFTGHGYAVWDVAVGDLAGQEVIVSCGGGGRDADVRVWDADGELIYELFPEDTAGVTAVAIGRFSERDVIVCGDRNGRVHLWDAAGRPIGEPLIGHSGEISAVTLGRIGDRDVIVSSSAFHALSDNDESSGEVRIWDSAGSSISKSIASPVYAVAVGRLEGSDIIVSGGGDGKVRVWDADGNLVATPLVGHTGPVASVTVGRLGDRDIIASGSSDRTVRLWIDMQPASILDCLADPRGVSILQSGGILATTSSALCVWRNRDTAIM
ncbi:hypothetical protein ACIA8K_29820 [Catenuloplanes sp. NPDC051500]|uniref:WD40 repeat domain-containing protein n=1 Tax=Catenuloplanes sp. NPDC051500 TaxID=3363959 RepID=UPI0037BE02E7